MIRAFYGMEKSPFSPEDIELLTHQQEVFDILEVHSHQGGLCLLMGEPGTGKSAIKDAVCTQDGKLIKVVHIGRTMHTYFNTIKILCHSFKIDSQGTSFALEKKLIEEAYHLKHIGKALIIIIDDAHLMDMQTLRKLRLLFEDFPKSHNLILVGQPYLMQNISLTVNNDIKSRVTYSTILPKLAPDDMENFILKQLDIAGLPHNTYTQEALSLIVRSCDGILRKVRNLCLSCMVEALRRQKKTIDIDNVNSVLIQPHWRMEKNIRNLQQ
jgi:MSHA biogenesis protein MshM